MEKEQWDQVGERFTSLGRRLKQHFDEKPSVGLPERDPLKEAIDAFSRAMEAMGDAVRDPAVQTEAKQAAKSLVDAVTSSLEVLAGEVKGRMKPGSTDKDDLTP